KSLIDRLVGDAHPLVVWIVDGKPPCDLLGTPRGRPSPILTSPMTSSVPPGPSWAAHRSPVLADQRSGETILHVATQLGVEDMLWPHPRWSDHGLRPARKVPGLHGRKNVGDRASASLHGTPCPTFSFVASSLTTLCEVLRRSPESAQYASREYRNALLAHQVAC